MSLNSEQLKAVHTLSGPMLVLAPPGVSEPPSGVGKVGGGPIVGVGPLGAGVAGPIEPEGIGWGLPTWPVGSNSTQPVPGK